MEQMIKTSDARYWLDQVFAAKAVASGGVVRRNRNWVDREIGRDMFLSEAQKRGYHVLETADQLIVVCHSGPVRMIF